MAKVKIDWFIPLLIFIVLITLHVLSFTSSSSPDGRQGLLSALGWAGGSAVLGYILISVGMLLFRMKQFLPGIIVLAIGIVLAVASFAVVWTWIKNNMLLTGALLAGAFLLYMSMRRKAKPQEINYYVQG